MLPLQAVMLRVAMKLDIRKVLDMFQVEPGRRVRLGRFDPGWAGGTYFKELSRDELKQRAQDYLQQNRRELSQAQELLWASDTYGVLVVFQAMDAAGKDGTIKHVMSGVNPQGCQVYSFKQPSKEELDHTFLWRYMKVLPERGRIVIFNRSHYEDVLVVKVHPELLEHAQLPDGIKPGLGPGKRHRKFWNARYDDINTMEHHLVRNGTVVLKFFLHVSKKEQKRRFMERLDNPDKHWKFSLADLAERGHWSRYMEAYEEMLSATSTKWAPWHVIPADHKWVTRALVSAILAEAINRLDLRYPQVNAEQHAALEKARRALMQE
jgi:PPK2 family polyphosphate:nucleotide phosphotransferase